MSRGRKRKTDKGLFSAASMKQAVVAVINGVDGQKLSLRDAALRYNVKYSTLFRYVKKAKGAQHIDDVRMTPKYESRLIFTSDQEKSLVEYMIWCSKMCYGKSTKDFRELAYEMAIINKIKIPASWEVNKQAGVDFMQGFMKRHPQLSIRQPEGCSLSRATSFNKNNVAKFYDNLEDVYKRSNAFADGSRVYNLDETGTLTVQKPKKVITEKGVKQVSQCTSGERGTLVTTCCIISAAGNSLPPAMVFPRKHFKNHMLNGAPPGTLGLVSNNGWMNGDIFPSVFKHFIKYSGSSLENPTLLVLDNHESHLSIETINLAKSNGVIIVTLPPHCSHKLQPLDVAVLAPFKAHYNAAVDSWLLHHPATPMTIYEVASCVGTAHDRAMTPSNLKKGFETTGIFPFDRNRFSDNDFIASSITDRELPTPDNNQTENQQIAEIRGEVTPPTEEQINKIVTVNELLAATSTTDKIAENHFISPQEFKGYPKAAARKNKKPRTKGRSFIPTDTPEKNILEEKDRIKKIKQGKLKQSTSNNKKQRTKKDKDEETSEEEIDTDVLMDDESDDDIEYCEEVDPSGFEELDRDPSLGDFVLVEFKAKKLIYFLGKVITEKNLTNELEIRFLRRSLKDDQHFIFPVLPDESLVPISDIKMILPPPLSLGTTKRLQCTYKFELNFNTIDVR